MASAGDKEPGALLTIGELSQRLGVAQHILRYWETRFPQLRPMQRAGNRRYYRAADVELATRINGLLNQEGYTVRGVQKLLRQRGGETSEPEVATAPMPTSTPIEPQQQPDPQPDSIDVFRLIALRDRLQSALES